MIRKVMIDSGAFPVWNRGATINLEEYALFAEANPDVSYYVNLDVIPGEKNNKKSLTPLAREEAAKQGYKNYRYLLLFVPKEKLIPVFHQHEDPKWLDKYLDFGTPYIGISPANDMRTGEKLEWMRSIRGRLFDGAGRPVVKTHGFAVTSYRLMKEWEWYSVDSKSWKDTGSWGGIYLPRPKNGGWDFTESPILVQTSPVLWHKARPDENIQSLMRTSERRKRLLDWLAFCSVELGAYTTRKASESYKLIPDQEYWFNKKKRIVLETKVKGVVTHFEERIKVNAVFMKHANKALRDTVKDIYFAGAPVPEYYNLEPKLGRRLLCYCDFAMSKETSGSRKCFADHVRLLKEKG